MNYATLNRMLPFAVWLAMGPACHKGISAMKEENQAPVVDQHIEKLRELITLPVIPAEVWFEQVPRGTTGGLGPNDYLLIAVMRFKPIELARITQHGQRRPGSPPRITSSANRPWFPEPVKAALRPYDDHSVSVRGEKFDAAPFAKSPFLSGTFSAIDGGEYVILVMETR
jgi:hypothetical protein